MIVVDASVLVPALGDDELKGDLARERLRDELLVAPELLDVEVNSAWRGMVFRGELDEGRAALARSDLRALRVMRVSHTHYMERCWELRANITTYDAVYVAIAEFFGVTLVTLDKKLAMAAADHCEVDLL